MSLAQKITGCMGGDWHGSYGTFPTPGHSPKDRGMSVKDAPEAPDGVLIHSHNGGDPLAVKDQLRDLGMLPPRQAANQPRQHAVHLRTGQRIVATYRFTEEGQLLYRTHRIEPGAEGRAKDFAYDHPDGAGGWKSGRGDGNRVPYRRDDIAAAASDTPLFMAEGEAKADKLADWGLLATSSKHWRPEFGSLVKARTVIILPDNDEEGRRIAEKTAKAVESAGGKAVLIDLPGLPHKGDLMDWGGSAHQLEQLTRDALRRQESGADGGRDLLPLIDISAWRGDPPSRRSAWGDMLPLLQTTMLTGEGGIGKSLFVQALLTHGALGLPFLGIAVEQRNVLYVTCEDDEAELWRRQAAICSAIGVSMQATLGKLFLCSLTGEPHTALATFNDSGVIQPTARWHELERTCEACDIGIFAFDNATDAMAGDLNDIHQVAEFVNMLTGLAIRRNGVAMIVHHPNKAGEDWLGSVAWHNKVRSRLIINRGDDEQDSDARVILNPKANYGPRGGRIAFRWYRGTFMRDEDLPADYAKELAETVAANAENTAFLRCLNASTERRQAVSDHPGTNFYATIFPKMPEAKGLKKAAFERAFARLLAIGAIELDAKLWQRENRAWKYGIRAVENCTDPRTDPRTDPLHQDAPSETHRPARTDPPSTTYITGAADEAGAPD